MPTDRHPNAGVAHDRPRRDKWVIAALTLATWLIASYFELHELQVEHVAKLERWQVDEMPLALMVLTAGLAWYSWRRRRESEAQLVLRRQAESRAEALLARNRELAQQLISVQEGERVALARELHDEFGQMCTAIRAETAFMRHCVRGDWDAALLCASRVDMAAQSLYQLVRNMLCRLRPADLDSLGLGAALGMLCSSWSERSGIACDVDCPGLESLPEATGIAVYRIVQEGLTNIARHSGATHVAVRIDMGSPSRPELRVNIRDNGCGMDTRATRRGLGQMGMVERAAALGGELEITSLPGQGVLLQLVFPLPPEMADERGLMGGLAP
jgi:signal transduction histidine kinase